MVCKLDIEPIPYVPTTAVVLQIKRMDAQPEAKRLHGESPFLRTPLHKGNAGWKAHPICRPSWVALPERHRHLSCRPYCIVPCDMLDVGTVTGGAHGGRWDRALRSVRPLNLPAQDVKHLLLVPIHLGLAQVFVRLVAS